MGTPRDVSGRKVSAFPYIGSKTFLAPWVVENLCEHETFVEAEAIQAIANLRWVPDRVASWHDAETTGVVTPSGELPFGGICLLEAETPVEIKGTQVRRSNGSGSRRGRWYIKRAAHERLVEAAGAYLLIVYVPDDPGTHLARGVLPAATMGDFLEERWYGAPDHRSEGEIAQLTWSTIPLFDPDDVEGRGSQ